MDVLALNRIRCMLFGIVALAPLAGDVLAAEWPKKLSSFFAVHCDDCHDADSRSGGLDIAGLSTNLNEADLIRTWTLIHDRIAAGEMPPKDANIPSSNHRQAVLKILGNLLSEADQSRREVVLRRLNRVEYENTIRDLFGTDVRLQQMLPEDASAHGFRNIGEALSVSAELMDVYLQAADTALDAIFGPADPPKYVKVTTNLNQIMTDEQKQHVRVNQQGVVLFNSGYNASVLRGCFATVPGTYRVRIQTQAFQSEQPVTMCLYGGVWGYQDRHVVGFFDVPADKLVTLDINVYQPESGDTIQPNPYGTIHNVGTGAQSYEGAGLFIGDITFEGPLEEWPPESRGKLIGDVDPSKGTLEDARAILTRILPLAVRRPTRAEEVEPYVALVRQAVEEGQSFQTSLRRGLKGILCSPEFLFLEEPFPDQAEGRISDHALASRLSYFLWSSMPDRELLAAARCGELKNPDLLREHVERMLADPKSIRFVENFTDQWLMLREIDFTLPDQKLYPDYDELLRISMLEEPRRFFQEILENDLSLLNFIDSDFVIVNGRMAQHYDIDAVNGQAFRKVLLPKNRVRGGVITTAAVMKVTANGTNTSPVTRGAWVLQNILGNSVPPPPPNIPGVDPDIRGATTIREQLDKHRNDPSCAVCHREIDPPGFALESFDVIGGWRDFYRTVGEGKWLPSDPKFPHRYVGYRRGPDVDSSGVTSDGRDFRDIRDYKKLLLADKQQIARCLSEKMLTYALGRGLGFSDRSDVETIVANVREKDFGFRTLVHEVVQSRAFHEP